MYCRSFAIKWPRNERRLCVKKKAFVCARACGYLFGWPIDRFHPFSVHFTILTCLVPARGPTTYMYLRITVVLDVQVWCYYANMKHLYAAVLCNYIYVWRYTTYTHHVYRYCGIASHNRQAKRKVVNVRSCTMCRITFIREGNIFSTPQLYVNASPEFHAHSTTFILLLQWTISYSFEPLRLLKADPVVLYWALGIVSKMFLLLTVFRTKIFI